jgi:methylmalonyl-CoA mutase N-terminal domain/subunit
MYIIAQNNQTAEQFANGQPYLYIATAGQMFGKTAKPLHVLQGWKVGKSTCAVRKIKVMLTAFKASPTAVVIRHDK